MQLRGDEQHRRDKTGQYRTGRVMRGPQAMTQTTRHIRHAGAQPLGLYSQPVLWSETSCSK
jgi:hypothetical protein